MKQKFAHLSFLDMTLNLRDSRLAKGTDLAVLYTLNSRVRADERYSCYPSLDSIAVDTGLNVKTVKRSIDRLLKANLLQKVQRFDNSNVYYLNTALMQDEADKNRAKTAANKLEEECMFALPRVAARATDAPPLDADAVPDKLAPVDNDKPSADEPEESSMDEIIALLRENFPEHATFALPNPTSVLKAPLQACIDMAGSGDRCFEVLTALCNDDSLKEEKARVAASKQLGGYIRGCFKDLMAKIGEKSSESVDEIMTRSWPGLVVSGPDQNYGKYAFTLIGRFRGRASEFSNWILDKAPNYVEDFVLDDRSHPLAEGEQAISFNLSQAYQASVILASHAGDEVDPTDLELLRSDLEVGAIARWAVADSRWTDRLKEASDVGEFFFEHLGEMIEERTTA